MDKNKLKIHYYCLTNKGGTSLYVHNLISNLFREYKNVTIYICGNYTFKNIDNYIKTINVSKRIEKKFNNIFIRKINTTISCFKGIRNFYRILKGDVNKKIIHAQFSFIFIDFYYLRKLKKNAKLFLTVHDVIPHKWIISKNIDLYFTKKTFEVFDYYIVHSNQNKYELAKYFKINKDNIFVVEHGIEFPRKINIEEVNRFRRNYNLPKNKKIILFFGNIRDDKGLDLLLKALYKINKSEYYLIIAGRTLNNYFYKKYLKIIKKLTLKNNVLFLNRFIEENEIPILFNIANFIVLPYKYFYSQSGVLSTAVSYKLPAIVSNTGSMGDFVKENGIGIVFEANSLEQLKESIQYFIGADLKKYKLNEVKCLKKYNWQKIAKKTLKVYNSVI